jgi:hypothetical protein
VVSGDHIMATTHRSGFVGYQALTLQLPLRSLQPGLQTPHGARQLPVALPKTGHLMLAVLQTEGQAGHLQR